MHFALVIKWLDEEFVIIHSSVGPMACFGMFRYGTRGLRVYTYAGDVYVAVGLN